MLSHRIWISAHPELYPFTLAVIQPIISMSVYKLLYFLQTCLQYEAEPATGMYMHWASQNKYIPTVEVIHINPEFSLHGCLVLGL